jgi:hypothetical protein
MSTTSSYGIVYRLFWSFFSLGPLLIFNYVAFVFLEEVEMKKTVLW